MSHFSVIVISEKKPDEDELHRILQPWHEFECDGVDDEYVVDVDVTDEMVADHAKYGEGKPFTLEWVEGWSGATFKDGRYFKHTNQAAKWDWWVIGGRWTGMLIPHYDPDKDPDNRQICVLCQGTGKRTDVSDPELQQKCNGCGGTGIETKWPTQWKRVAGDQMRLGDIPLVTLRDEAERKALSRYDEASEVIVGRPIPDWDALRSAHELEQARKIYNTDPVITDLRAAKVLGFFDEVGEFAKPRADVARSARAQAICPFAVVHEGKWYERGKMGWWACVSDEKDRDVWAEEFNALLDKLSPDVWLTVVDCHI
jgi:hypothetical protein